jgi:hypothetical protein
MKKSFNMRRRVPYFAYFVADSKEIELAETVSLDFRYSDLFRDSISELQGVAVLVSSTEIR